MKLRIVLPRACLILLCAATAHAGALPCDPSKKSEPAPDLQPISAVLLLAQGGQTSGGGGDFDGIEASEVLGSLSQNLSDSPLSKRILAVAKSPWLKIYMNDGAQESSHLTGWAKDGNGNPIPLVYLQRKSWQSKDLPGREAMLHRELCKLASGKSCQSLSEQFEATRRSEILKEAQKPVDCTFMLFEFAQPYAGVVIPGNVVSANPVTIDHPGRFEIKLPLSPSGSPAKALVEFGKDGEFSMQLGESTQPVQVFDPLNDPTHRDRFAKDETIQDRYILRSTCQREH
jgi:hypothetical protein